MDKIFEINSVNEELNTELNLLESILDSLYCKCMHLELNSKYYSVDTYKLELSKERNNNINLLKLALNQLEHIKTKNSEIEYIIVK